MRGFVITTAAVLVLGLGAAAPGYASGYSSKASGSTSPSAASSTSQPRMAAAKITTSEVKRAQERLRAAHLYKGRIDGKVGHGTRLALAQFQRRHGLRVTSRLDSATMTRLMAATATGSSMPPRHAAKKMTPPATKTPSKPETTKSGAGSGSSVPPTKPAGSSAGTTQPPKPAGSNAGATRPSEQK